MAYQVYNPLLGDWTVVVSPERSQRPWQGQQDAPHESAMPAYDQACFLCPGNARAGGQTNPDYVDTYVFPNDFAALSDRADTGPDDDGGLFRTRPQTGVCEVLCYTPRHDQPLFRMPHRAVGAVVAMWQARYRDLGGRPDIGHVQLFENHGTEMGASSPHPHGQVWAQSDVPALAAREAARQAAYHADHARHLLLDYAYRELAHGSRVVMDSGHFVALVPYWAVWPYELLLIPKSPCASVADLDGASAEDLAALLHLTLGAYAKLFQRPAYGPAYTMGLHNMPTDGGDYPGYQFHIHIELPWLTPHKQKFLVGYERFANPQRDLTPEQAAAHLRQALAGGTPIAGAG